MGKGKKFTLKGITKITENINKEVKKMEGKVTSKGFIRVAMDVYDHMEKNYPLIPLDTGNLRASYFATIKGSDASSKVGSGYSRSKTGKEDKAHQQQIVAMAKSVVESQPHPAMVFGFSANYALMVHEKMEAEWSRPGSGPKYFEAALKANQNKIIETLRQSIVL
jgi:hypothetical protein